MEIPAQVPRARLWLLVLSFATVLLASPSIASARADHADARAQARRPSRIRALSARPLPAQVPQLSSLPDSATNCRSLRPEPRRLRFRPALDEVAGLAA